MYQVFPNMTNTLLKRLEYCYSGVLGNEHSSSEIESFPSQLVFQGHCLIRNVFMTTEISKKRGLKPSFYRVGEVNSTSKASFILQKEKKSA